MDVFFGLCLGCLLTLAVVTSTGASLSRSRIETWQQKCRDAGGVPAITARGPDVCLNPSAIVELK